MLLNPKFGIIGMLAYPYYFFLEMLGAAIEVAGYAVFILAIVIGRASGPYVVAFLLVAFVLGIALSVAAVGLEELTFRRYPRMKDLLALFGLAVLEGFGYRQIATLWRVRGLVSVLRRKKGWGEMTRKGFAAPASPPHGLAPTRPVVD
jgi:arginine exporter protein ArgO